MSITIEQVEELALRDEADDTAKREKLWRLIRAECRILRLREPPLFKRQPLEIADEDGYWDSSYPPKIVAKDHHGPACICVRRGDWMSIATEGGFYHAWRAVTGDGGLYVGTDGTILTRDFSGHGHYGQFAAHPGNSGVEIAIEYCEADCSTAELAEVESHLRDLAFPASAEGGE